MNSERVSHMQVKLTSPVFIVSLMAVQVLNAADRIPVTVEMWRYSQKSGTRPLCPAVSSCGQPHKTCAMLNQETIACSNASSLGGVDPCVLTS
jgi:hypothetical protein